MAAPMPETGRTDLELLRESVRRFAEAEVAPHADAFDQAGGFPRSLWRRMGELGFLGLNLPEVLGGSGMGFLAHVLAMEELSRASASVGLSYGAHSNLCLHNLARNGTEEQKRRYLPKLISGEWVGALAMSESGAGSDVVGSIQCRAERRHKGWVVNGTKMWITNGPEADVLIVYLRTRDYAQAGSRSLTAFIVERSQKGFTTAQKLDKLGMRGSGTCELLFDACELRDDQVLGTVHEGVEILMSGLDSERLILSGGPLGIMQACLDLVLPYLVQRRQFGRPIGEFELMQGKLADMYTKLEASRSLTYRVAESFDRGHPSRIDAAAALLMAAESAVAVALESIQCLGGNGYINDYPTGRFLRDAKLYEIGAGTNEIRRMLIGRELYERHSQPDHIS
ncbi:MAG: acyl-CoA dehydrogenase family protein [Gammaproteobacteria bacterium]